MLRKSLLLLGMISCLTSCNSVTYDSEIRLVYEGRCVDSDNQPLANINIAIFAQPNLGPELYDYGDRIAMGRTDAYGYYRLIIPAPQDESDLMAVQINSDGYVNNPYQFKTYSHILRSDLSDYTFRTDPVVLYRNDESANLAVDAVTNNPQHRISNIRIAENPAAYYIELHPYIPDYEVTYLQFNVVRNQTVNLTYDVTNYTTTPVTTTQHSDTVFISSAGNQNYTINY